MRAAGRAGYAQASGTTEMKRPAPFSAEDQAAVYLGKDGVIDADAGVLAGAELVPR